MNAPALTTEPWTIREARATDLGFVFDAWKESFYVGAPAVQYADRDHYRREMHDVFTALKDASVLVCCDAEDDDTLIGFVVHTKRELHYVYVRADFRKAGVAKALCERADPESYTFRTLAGERRLRPRDRGWKFTPRFTL